MLDDILGGLPIGEWTAFFRHWMFWIVLGGAGLFIWAVVQFFLNG